MKIADGVEMLALEMDLIGHQSTIHPTLLYDDRHSVLIDVGIPGQLEAIKAAVEQAGVRFDSIDAVILTHQDIDHVGSIQDVLKSLGKPIDVYAHAEDQPYIEGNKAPIKMNRERVAQMLESLPEEMRTRAEAIMLHPVTAKVTKTVSDGEVIPFFGGLQVIFTPGHTPGHISLYHQTTKTLIAGDATVSADGTLLGPNQQATLDMQQALESQRKFTSLDISKVICYHGGLCAEQVNEQFRKLAQ